MSQIVVAFSVPSPSRRPLLDFADTWFRVFLTYLPPSSETYLWPIFDLVYRHIQKNVSPFNSKTFQDGIGNGNFREINSNDFQDGNWEPMDMKGSLQMPRR